MKYLILQNLKQVLEMGSERLLNQNNIILLSNWHITHTSALVRDFLNIGFTVYMPNNNWDGRIKYYHSNEGFEGVILCSYDEFKTIEANKWVLCGCTEQMWDFIRFSEDFDARLVYTVSKNNAEYPEGTSDYLLSPDIQTLNSYPAKHKMLYFYTPKVYPFEKDLRTSFDSMRICTYIHNYEKFWQSSYNHAKNFASMFTKKVYFYGTDCEDGELSHEDVHKNMASSMFTLYFKEKESYGSMVLESMLLGTPVIALKQFIEDKTIGQYFLNETNSIIVDSPEEAIGRLFSLTFEEYCKMSSEAIKTVKDLTNDEIRLDLLRNTIYG